MSSEIAKRAVMGALMGSHYAPLYPVFESDEDEKDKEPYVGKEPSRIEKIKEGLKTTGWFILGLLGQILVFVVFMCIPVGMAAIIAFVTGIFHQGSDYPFFNLFTFQVAGSFLGSVFLLGYISGLIHDGDEFKDALFP